MRYHPAIVAQQAATVQILADGRFVLGLGSGENLNEHVVGKGWPTVERRQDMLREAIKVIRELFGGGLVNWRGDYFQVDSARLWDVPEVPVGVAVAMGGTKAIDKFAKRADHLVAVAPVSRFHRCGARPDRRRGAGSERLKQRFGGLFQEQTALPPHLESAYQEFMTG